MRLEFLEKKFETSHHPTWYHPPYEDHACGLPFQSLLVGRLLRWLRRRRQQRLASGSAAIPCESAPVLTAEGRRCVDVCLLPRNARTFSIDLSKIESSHRIDGRERHDDLRVPGPDPDLSDAKHVADPAARQRRRGQYVDLWIHVEPGSIADA